ncbi:MAG: hypothetical protein KDE58_06580, partial [Caldilineaceae bacterium]|nr:hypothetical protein [Caldilineaceae bacterium]
LTNQALNNWHAILQEAEKRVLLVRLLEVVGDEYGENPKFQAIRMQVHAQQAIPNYSNRMQMTLWQMGFGILLIGLLVIVGVYALPTFHPDREAANTPVATVTEATPQPTATGFIYGVKVLDAAGQYIADAQVIVDIQGYPPLENGTDDFGYTLIEVPSDYAAKPGHLRVIATGYEPFDQFIGIYPEQLPNEIQLTRQ